MTAYEIRVRGHLDPGLVAELSAQPAEEQPATTVLIAEIDDEAGLRAFVERVGALGLELLAMRQVGSDRSRP